MNLNKTISNLRKSKHSFFNLNSDCYINYDLLKVGVSYNAKVYDINEDEVFVLNSYIRKNWEYIETFEYENNPLIMSFKIYEPTTNDYIYIPFNCLYKPVPEEWFCFLNK